MNTTATPTHWTLIKSFPFGHKFFRTDDPTLIGIADGSGSTPDNTDDGPLYFDETRFIEAHENGFSIPIRDKFGRKLVTPCDGREALWLASFKDHLIKAGGVRYAVSDKEK